MSAYKSKVKKAVIPVAGLGTRMLPATKAIPKEMLPLVDKPLIQYVVNECIAAGITEIVLVTHSSKNAIENHFDTSFELESMLEKRVKRQLLEEIQSICPPHVTIMQVRQGLAKGLGHAVMCAYPVVGDEPFAVILPDVIIDEYESNLATENLADMMRRFDETGRSQIMVEPVADVTAYGVWLTARVLNCLLVRAHRWSVWLRSLKRIKPLQTWRLLAVMFCLLISGHCWRKRLQVQVMKFS